MNSKNVITIGSAINLEINNYIDTEEIIKLKTMIQGYENDIIMVNLPTKEGVPYIPSSKSEIKAVMRVDSVGLCTFYLKLVDKILLDGIPCLSFKIDSEIKKAQRRQYFRLDFLGEIIISIEEFSENMDEYMQQPFVNSKILEEPVCDGEIQIINKFLKADGRDISGGGFKAICRMPFDVDSEIYGRIKLDSEYIPFRGRVVRCLETEDDIDEFEIGVFFIEMDESIRTKIISFIFDRQRKQMKK